MKILSILAAFIYFCSGSPAFAASASFFDFFPSNSPSYQENNPSPEREVAQAASASGHKIEKIGAFQNFEKEKIISWLNSEHTRGNQHLKNQIASSKSMVYCSGAGCPTKIPFTFSSDDLRAVAAEMERGRRIRNCIEQTANCEIVALQFGVVKMDQIVKEKKLNRMSAADVEKRTVERATGGGDISWVNGITNGQQFLRDCVDQAANGTNFLIILGNQGLIKHHKILEPGLMHLPNPHWFTRIQNRKGTVYRFDLYNSDRTGFGKLPGVEVRK